MPRIRIPDVSQNTWIWSHYWTWKTPKNLIGVILIAVLGLLDLPPIIFPLAIHTKLALSQHFSCSLPPSQLMRLCTAFQQLEVCFCPMHTDLHHPVLQLCVIYHAEWVFCCGILPEPRRRKREKFSSACSCFGCVHFCPLGL